MQRHLEVTVCRAMTIGAAAVGLGATLACATGVSPTAASLENGSGGTGAASGSGHGGSGGSSHGSGNDQAQASGQASGDGTSTGSPGAPSSGRAPGTSTGSPSPTPTASAGSSTGSPSGPSPNGSMPPDLPKVMGTCPMFTNGGTATITAGSGSIQAQIWMGAQGGGPVIIYWHGTASSPAGEIPIAFDTNAVAAAGGIIVGFNANTRTGATNGNTGDAVWYTSDGAFADQAVACAIQNNHADPTHIHTAGYSAGGLQTVWMWYARSGYIASVISYSGGSALINQAPMQDSMNLAPAIAAHGAPGSDNLIVDFANASVSWEMSIKMGGGFSIDCNDGGSHLDFFGKRAPGLKPVAFKFFQDHPFGVKPDPYASALPAGFPSYCKID
ncbi:MAG TPA: hypothetical protein VKU41_09685 [Polyangiaceae bacterium]|nr:hypothetical protein [Polyangiaceae bacterium]